LYRPLSRADPFPFIRPLFALAHVAQRQETFVVSTISSSQARVVEISGVAAGIVIAEEGGFRFFSAQQPFDPLDGRFFRSIKRVLAAAQDRLRQSNPKRKQRPISIEEVHMTSNLLLAVPHPFLLPV
jgi:hypothetical protein